VSAVLLEFGGEKLRRRGEIGGDGDLDVAGMGGAGGEQQGNQKSSHVSGPDDLAPRLSQRRRNAQRVLADGHGGADDQSDDAKASTEWAEHFQKNYRLMTDEEKAEARTRLERRYSSEYGKKVAVDTTGPQPGMLMGYA
jgi:hypothetical protein